MCNFEMEDVWKYLELASEAFLCSYDLLCFHGYVADNLLGISWVDSGWVPILNPGNVLDYFSERSNPFYDRTCNNEIVKMQRLTLEHLK